MREAQLGITLMSKLKLFPGVLIAICVNIKAMEEIKRREHNNAKTQS